MTRTVVTLLGVVLLILGPQGLLAHSEGLDDRGCHHNRTDGSYHCHSGPLEGRSFANEAKAEEISPEVAYDRNLYGGWRDVDGDCQDTRTEVLVREADGPIIWESPRQCEIKRGTWHGPYTGQTYHDPSKLHIDHLVPLKEAHVSGASRWSAKRKRDYNTDLWSPYTLNVVGANVNMSKEARDPADWLPPNPDFHCEYVRRWVTVKKQWDLAMDEAEHEAISEMCDQCSWPRIEQLPIDTDAPSVSNPAGTQM